MLAKIFGRLQAKDKSQDVVKRQQGGAVSLWKDTGQVYYLENTLKLTYQSNAGAITLEKIALDDLPEILHQLQSVDANSPLARKEVANQTDAFSVSVCGVTWQTSENGDSVRIKALPEAAALRSPTACFAKSQAIFKHAFMLEHDDLLTPISSSNKPGIFIYNRISIGDFTKQIARANARLAPAQKAKVAIGQDNFSSAFTEHEQSAIEQFVHPDNPRNGLLESSDSKGNAPAFEKDLR